MKTNGPVPMGSVLICSSLPAFSNWSAYSAEYIDAMEVIVRSARKGDSALVSVMRTVWSSTLLTDLMSSGMLMPAQ